uniref:Uncharacterized protein n=1 Tax=Globodera rostochiensis TaxID=31243 RepID=A0A914I021_GLORO
MFIANSYMNCVPEIRPHNFSRHPPLQHIHCEYQQQQGCAENSFVWPFSKLPFATNVSNCPSVPPNTSIKSDGGVTFAMASNNQILNAEVIECDNLHNLARQMETIEKRYEQQQNETAPLQQFPPQHFCKQLVRNSENLATRNDALAEENSELMEMKKSFEASQKNVLVLEQKCHKLKQQLNECKEFLNRMAMEDDFRNNSLGAKDIFIVEDEKEIAEKIMDKTADDGGPHNSSEIIFVDDVIRNKWVPPIGHNAVKTEPVEVVLIEIEEDGPSAEPVLNGPRAKKGSDEDAQAVQQQQQDGNSWGQSSQYSEYGSSSGNGVGDSLSGGWNSVGMQTYGNDMIQAENCDDDQNNNNNDQNDGGNGGQQMTSTNGETNYYSNSNYSSNSNSNASLSEGDGNQQPGQGQTNSNSASYYYYNSYSNATNGRQEQTSGSSSESNLYSSNSSYYNNSSNSNYQEDNQQLNGQQGQNSSNSNYSNSDEDDGEQQPLTSTTESIYDASSNYNTSSSQHNYNYSYEYYSNSQNYTQNGGNSNSQQNYQYSYSQNSSSNSQNSQDGDNNSGNALTQSKEQTLQRQARARLAACVHAISVLLWQGYKELLVNNGTSCNTKDTNGGSTASTCSKPELDDVALQLSQNEFGQQLNQTVDGNGPYGSFDGCVSADQVPTTEQLVAMIKQYSYTYELINGQSSGISINESSSESEITSAIGTIMRQTSQLQRQLQNDSKK